MYVSVCVCVYVCECVYVCVCLCALCVCVCVCVYEYNQGWSGHWTNPKSLIDTFSHSLAYTISFDLDWVVKTFLPIILIYKRHNYVSII